MKLTMQVQMCAFLIVEIFSIYYNIKEVNVFMRGVLYSIKSRIHEWVIF